MSDVLKVTETSITRDVAGEKRVFAFLTAYDRAELLRADLEQRQKARAEKKKNLLENLKLAGITGETMFAELENFDAQYPETVNEEDWITLVNSPLAEIDIYTKSLKAYPEAEAIAKGARLSIEDKAKICGLSIVTRQAEGTPDPNPSTPAVYGIPAQDNSTGPKPSVE